MSKDIKIKHNGFSFEMTNFSTPYKKWVETRKRYVKIIAYKWLTAWANNVRDLSRIYTPESGLSGDNSLAESIIVAPIRSNSTGTRLQTQVGIASWHSNYDEWYKDMFGEKPPWGESSVDLAINIHENWDAFVVSRHRIHAQERALQKSARYGGVKVGGKFLYRGTKDYSTNRNLREIGKRLLQEAFSKNNVVMSTMIKTAEISLDV